MYLTFNFIIGLSFGFEYQEDDAFDYLVIDLLFVRLLLAKEKDEANQN